MKKIASVLIVVFVSLLATTCKGQTQKKVPDFDWRYPETRWIYRGIPEETAERMKKLLEAVDCPWAEEGRDITHDRYYKEAYRLAALWCAEEHADDSLEERTRKCVVATEEGHFLDTLRLADNRWYGRPKTLEEAAEKLRNKCPLPGFWGR